MPRTRSGKEHDPVKAEEDRRQAEERAEFMREVRGKAAQRKQEAAKKKMLAHFKMAVTKKHKVGSIKLGKKTGGKTRRQK